MTDVKINASFVLPGGTLLAEPPLLKKRRKKEKEEKQNECLYRQEIIHAGRNRIVINLRVPKPARQSLHLSQDAYDYFVAPENPVYGIKVFDWKKLSKNKRVKAHLQVIAESLGGELESFTILED